MGIQRIDIRTGRHVQQRFDQSVFKTIHPPVQIRAVVFLPGPLDNGCLRQVRYLFDDIKLKQALSVRSSSFSNLIQASR